MDKIVSKLDKHEIEIDYIKKSLNELVEYSKETSKQLQKISESITKQEVILEKISNLEEKYQDGMKRLHYRIDNVEKSISNEKDGIIRRIEKLEDDKQNMISKPCITHKVIENEIKHINDTLNKHNKIFWTAISGIVMIVIISIIKANMK